jgi:hypothetical protein
MLRRLSALTHVVAAARRACAVVANSCRTLIVEQTYRPEAHYMRGPGPKWREKHAAIHDSAVR